MVWYELEWSGSRQGLGERSYEHAKKPLADRSGRVVWDTDTFSPLKPWGRGFESHSTVGCVCLLCLCCPVCKLLLPLWSSGQRSWPKIQRSGFDARRYQIFWEVVGLERGPLSLVTVTEELTGRKSSGSGLENRESGRRNPLRWPRNTFYPQKSVLTSPTSGGRSVSIVCLRTRATEFTLFV
jgi:hypothetical protein